MAGLQARPDRDRMEEIRVSAAIVVLTTLPAASDPSPLVRALVDERLAACVNVLPQMRSVYRWKGGIEEDDEWQLVIKTSPDRLAALEARLRALHPYEVPEFLVLAVEGGSEAYLAWVRSATAEPPG